jgi:DNA-binding PadR family transcriptional regulator
MKKLNLQDKTKKIVVLGDLEKYILMAILNQNNNAYGTEIRRDIKERTYKDVSVGALYTTLERLQEKGFIESTIAEGTAERGGRARKYFRVSTLGQPTLKQSLEAIEQMLTTQPMAI